MRTLLLIAGLFFLGVIFLPLMRYTYRTYLIRRWKKKWHLDEHEKEFNALYHDINGFGLSKEARITGDALEYLYGEIDFLSFIAMLHLARPHPHTIFYDLGSGTGKAIIAAAMLYDMKHYIGIELFKPLHDAAIAQKKKLGRLKRYQKRAKRIQLINANFLETPFHEATLIFMNATAFLGETWEQLNEALEQTALGTQVISVSKKLTSPQFTERKATFIQMSWGVATIYLYEHTGPIHTKTLAPLTTPPGY